VGAAGSRLKFRVPGKEHHGHQYSKIRQRQQSAQILAPDGVMSAQGGQFSLFASEATAPSTSPIVGLTVKLDRPGDRIAPCHANLATVGSSRGPHHHALACSECGGHRGWLGAKETAFLVSVVNKFGAPTEPIVIRNHLTEEDNTMSDHVQRDNSGLLFKNDDKAKETDRDYGGSMTINRVQYWLSGWVKKGKRGPFLSLVLRAHPGSLDS